jgi:hypothetical protein
MATAAEVRTGGRVGCLRGAAHVRVPVRPVATHPGAAQRPRADLISPNTQARWIHQRPEERLGRFIPNRGRDGHMQYVPRCVPPPLPPPPPGGLRCRPG